MIASAHDKPLAAHSARFARTIRQPVAAAAVAAKAPGLVTRVHGCQKAGNDRKRYAMLRRGLAQARLLSAVFPNNSRL